MHRKFGETVLSWPRVLISWLNWQLLFFLVLFFLNTCIFFFTFVFVFSCLFVLFFLYIYLHTQGNMYILYDKPRLNN